MFRPDILFEQLYGLSWYGGLLEDWVRNMDIRPGQPVLEIGCGTGALVRSMRKHGIDAKGIDRSERMIEAGHRHDRRFSPDILLADALDLPFAEQRFERVIAASLINVVREIRPVLLEMKRVLRPGGSVSLLFPGPKMTPARASGFVQENHLTGFSAAALQAWAHKARKGDLQLIEDTLCGIGFTEIDQHHFLDNMVVAIDARQEHSRRRARCG